MWRSFRHEHFCGLFNSDGKYFPQVKVAAHITILSSVARTVLTQTFENTDAEVTWKEVKYTFPLIDGVSVVAFNCTVGDRVIKGVVKEKQKAREVYEEARDRGDRAALLEQVSEASDVFLTSVGNVPPKTKVHVEVTYLGELAHDAEVDGIRATIPTTIAPRYGDLPESMRSTTAVVNTTGEGGLDIVVDAQMPSGSVVKSIQSPSHPISVSIGTLSSAPHAEASLQNASASLSLPTAGLEKDFVLQVVITNTSNPVAMLEKHPTLPNERALMATLVPKFALPPERPEIVFVCDRSGSMSSGNRIGNLRTALKIFLKSLPVGVKFNICSFGGYHTFLWDKSRSYDKASVAEAMRHVETFDADMGGTKMYQPVEDVFKRRYGDMNLEVLLLTDGDIWRQDEFFQLIRRNREESNNAIRLFSLAIGSGSSSALAGGSARAGNGFFQSVGDNEKMNSKVVRMLKAALTPHINDYTLEVKYEADQGSDDDFELIEKVHDCLVINEATQSAEPAIPQKTTSLFDPSVDVDSAMGKIGETESSKYDHLPPVPPPKLLQAPFEIPPLYPFNRTNVYMLMSNETVQKPVKSVILRATSQHGPLELEIPVTTLDEPGETVHQLAARKAVKELEEGAGWIYHAKDADHKLLKERHPGRFSDMVEREAVRLGVKYQVGGKWCSFVAVEENESRDASRERERIFELGPAISRPPPPSCSGGAGLFGGGPGSEGAPTYRRRMNLNFAPAADLFDATSLDPGLDPMSLSTETGFESELTLGASQSSGLFNTAPLPQQGQPPATGGGIFGSANSPPQPQYARLSSFSHVNAGSPIASARQRGERLDSLSVSAYSARHSSKSGKPLSFEIPIPAEDQGAKKGGFPSDKLEALVSLQGFDGSWPSSEDVFSVIGVSKEKIEEALEAKRTDWSEGLVKGGADALATAGALTFLKEKMGDRADEWEMVGDKAWSWLVEAVPALDGNRGNLEASLVRLF